MYLLPYIEQMYNNYNLVLIPNRKVNKSQLQQLLLLANSRKSAELPAFKPPTTTTTSLLLLNSFRHYNDLKLAAEFLLADVIIDELTDVLSQQLNSMTSEDMLSFFQLPYDFDKSNDPTDLLTTHTKANLVKFEMLLEQYLSDQ